MSYALDDLKADNKSLQLLFLEECHCAAAHIHEELPLEATKALHYYSESYGTE